MAHVVSLLVLSARDILRHHLDPINTQTISVGLAAAATPSFFASRRSRAKRISRTTFKPRVTCQGVQKPNKRPFLPDSESKPRS